MDQTLKINFHISGLGTREEADFVVGHCLEEYAKGMWFGVGREPGSTGGADGEDYREDGEDDEYFGANVLLRIETASE